ncbi:MAG: twin-arginine translocase TatA/TatE family subunit [Ignavibacteria bacterium]|nr:twin-arginine translocase TatA/TatE family subunit [Ignavibacteria bacterium]
MFDIGGAEFLLIGLAILMLFGPKKIPEIMQAIGKGIRYFRQAQEDLKTQIRDISTEVEKQTSLNATIHQSVDSNQDMTTEITEDVTETITIKPADGSIPLFEQDPPNYPDQSPERP